MARLLVYVAAALGAALLVCLLSSPGGAQLGATLLAALALRPAPAPAPSPAVIDLPDAELLYHLILNVRTP